MKKLYNILSKIVFILLTITFSIFIFSCDDDDDDVEIETGKVVFKFAHFIGGSEFIKDSMMYTNAAGNQS